MAEHQHEESWESATSPTHSGSITVTVHCDCGHVVRVYNDSIL